MRSIWNTWIEWRSLILADIPCTSHRIFPHFHLITVQLFGRGSPLSPCERGTRDFTPTCNHETNGVHTTPWNRSYLWLMQVKQQEFVGIYRRKGISDVIHIIMWCFKFQLFWARNSRVDYSIKASPTLVMARSSIHDAGSTLSAKN